MRSARRSPRTASTSSGETLAVDLIAGEVEGFRQEAAIEGEPVAVSLRKAAYASPSPS